MSDTPRSLCFELPNLPGTLEPVVTALANARVNINSIVSHGGRLVINVDDPETLRAVLRRDSIPYHELGECDDRTPRTAEELADRLLRSVERLNHLVEVLRHRGGPIDRIPQDRRDDLTRIVEELTGLLSL